MSNENKTESKLYGILDRIRLASIIVVIGTIGALVALVTGELSYVEFAAAIGAISAGAGVLGLARNGAGHGVG